MAPNPVSLDDPTSLQSFINSVSARLHPSTSSTKEVSQMQLTPDNELEEREVVSEPSQSQLANDDERHGPSASTPTAEHKPNDPVPISPPRKGLMPPQYTPRTAQATPLHVPAVKSSSEQTPTSIGDAIYDYFQGIKGVPLNESIWAPKHRPHRQSLWRGPPTLPNNPIPVNEAKHKVDTDQTFARMSFRVAGSTPKHGMAHATTQTEPFLSSGESTLLTNPSRSRSSSNAADAAAIVQLMDVQKKQTSEEGVNSNENQGDTLGGEIRRGNLKATRSKEMASSQLVASDLGPNKIYHAEDPLGHNFSGLETGPRQILVTKEQRERIIQRLKEQDERTEAERTERIRRKMEELGMAPLEVKSTQYGRASNQPHSSLREPQQSSSQFSIPTVPPGSPKSRENDTALKKSTMSNQTSGADLRIDSWVTTKLSTENAKHTYPQSERCSEAAIKAAGPNLSSSFLDKWGSKMAQTANDQAKEEIAKGEISPTTLAFKEALIALGKAESSIQDKADISMPKKSIGHSTPSSFMLQDKTSIRQASMPSLSQVTAEEDRTDQVYFSSWGVRQKRDRPAAQIRTVQLSGLPVRPTIAFVARLVFGGPLEQIRVSNSPTNTTASVVFLYDADCKKFYDETSNGLVYGKDDGDREKVAWVSLGKDVDVVSEKLMQYMAMDYSRCVKVVPLDKDYEKSFLWEYASEKGRRVGDIELGKTKGGARYVIFGFADIAHAVQFHATLRRDVEFERCNITYAKDPCAGATGPRII